MDPRIDRIRSFSRTVTHRFGVLDQSFLGRGFPLGHARLLFELDATPLRIRDLRTRLGLDSGYVSRMLRALERKGLLTTRQDEHDGRVRVAELTASGRRELTELGQRADSGARDMLSPLSEAQQQRLVDAMADVERLLRAGEVELVVEDPASERAATCFARFFAELDERFAGGFEADRSLPADPADLRPPAGVLILAVLPDGPVGCGALKRGADGHAEIKRMWVDPTLRGAGVGRRVLEALEHHAREGHTHTLRLETNDALGEAQALYEHCGYERVAPFSDEPYAHHWFEKSLG